MAFEDVQPPVSKKMTSCTSSLQWQQKKASNTREEKGERKSVAAKKEACLSASGENTISAKMAIVCLRGVGTGDSRGDGQRSVSEHLRRVLWPEKPSLYTLKGTPLELPALLLRALPGQRPRTCAEGRKCSEKTSSLGQSHSARTAMVAEPGWQPAHGLAWLDYVASWEGLFHQLDRSAAGVSREAKLK